MYISILKSKTAKNNTFLHNILPLIQSELKHNLAIIYRYYTSTSQIKIYGHSVGMCSIFNFDNWFSLFSVFFFITFNSDFNGIYYEYKFRKYEITLRFFSSIFHAHLKWFTQWVFREERLHILKPFFLLFILIKSNI